MNKWPSKIYKVKWSFGSLNGYVWLDRWEENIWFEANGRLFVPLQVNKFIKLLPFEKQLNLNFKLVYAEPIISLLPISNPFLKLIPKTTDLFYAPVLLPWDIK